MLEGFKKVLSFFFSESEKEDDPYTKRSSLMLMQLIVFESGTPRNRIDSRLRRNASAQSRRQRRAEAASWSTGLRTADHCLVAGLCGRRVAALLLWLKVRSLVAFKKLRHLLATKKNKAHSGARRLPRSIAPWFPAKRRRLNCRAFHRSRSAFAASSPPASGTK